MHDTVFCPMCFVIITWQHFAKKCRSCVAGGPGRVSIVNRHYTQGISLHGFPSDEKDSKRRRQRNRFVIKALSEFRAIGAFVLTCSTHFEGTKNLGNSAPVGMKRTRRLLRRSLRLPKRKWAPGQATREFIGGGVYSLISVFLFCPTNSFLNQLLLGYLPRHFTSMTFLAHLM